MKKILSLILCLLGLLGIASCGDSNTDSNPTPNPTPTPETKSYNISFYDENSNLLETKSFKENSKVSYSYEPEDTKEYDYSFVGWLKNNQGEALTALPKATETASYYAKVSKVKQQYTISFETNGGSEISSIKEEYGYSLNKPADPSREGYRFMGWFKDAALTELASFPLILEDNITIYAKWQEEVKVLDYLNGLLKGYKMDPWSYIPEVMQPEGNIVSNINADFTTNRSVSSINNGYGEEWAMILDNLSQSEAFFKGLSLIEGLSSASIVAYRNYLDTNPSDVNSFTHESGKYTVIIKFENNIISYGLSYSGNIPLVGDTTISIIIAMDVTTGIRSGRISAGESNALRYTVTNDSYTFGIKYLNSREAYFECKRNDDGSVTGKIYEFLHLKDKTLSNSAAEFYIDDNYLSAVGNKASGLIGFKGYISELYNVKTGKLLGYEVMETKTLFGLEITFNTLWFNLEDITGINSVKALKPEKPDSLNPDLIYINNSNEVFKTKNVGGLGGKMKSRRFDIELRKNYLYTLDSEEKLTRVEVLNPMLFIQSENLVDFVEDIKESNAIDVSLRINADDLNKLENDYETLIPIFIENKNNVTQDKIIEFIG